MKQFKICILMFLMAFLLCSCIALQPQSSDILFLNRKIEKVNSKINEIYHRLSVIQFMVDNHERTLTRLERFAENNQHKNQDKNVFENNKYDSLKNYSKKTIKKQIKPKQKNKYNRVITTKNKNNDPQSLYNQARKAYLNKDFKLALSLFKSIIKKFPDNQLAVNALYWAGESCYSQKKYSAAINLFKQVLKKYPKGNKTPDALLKIGYSYLAMDDNANAKLYLKKVVKQYPFTQSGNLAEEKLNNINN